MPIHVKDSVDVVDMIQGAVQAVIQALPKYNPEKSSGGTFACTVAISYFRNVLNSHNQLMRKTEGIVALEDWAGASSIDTGIKFRESRKSFEVVLQKASPSLCNAMAVFLEDRKYIFTEYDIAELQRLSRVHNIRRKDFERVLQVV